MLLQLEQECLDIYRRKVERSRKYKAELHQCLAEFEAEIAQLTSALGERVSMPQVCLLLLYFLVIERMSCGHVSYLRNIGLRQFMVFSLFSCHLFAALSYLCL